MKFSLYISAVPAACEAALISGGCLAINPDGEKRSFSAMLFIALRAERKV